MATRMQQRRGTASQWVSTNSGNGPILNAGEIGFESDTNKFKIGDGVNHWVDLTYFTDADAAIAALSGVVDGAPGLLDTLNELAAAIGDDPNFITTVSTNLSNHQSDTTNIHGISDTAELATKSFAASLLTGASKTNITITGDKDGLIITAENGVGDSTTTDLAEGTNLYFTNERAQDAVGNAVGTGLTYTDETGAISVTPLTYESYGLSAQALTDAQDYTDAEIEALDALKVNISDPAVDYYITNAGFGAYVVNGVSNGTLYFEKGKKYRIHVNATGHPFWIQTVSGAYSSGDVYSTGITNNGTANGHILVELGQDAPQLYYACQYHSSMAGSINIGSSVSNLTVTGNITIEGSTVDDFETTLVFADATADRTITFPNNSGTIAFTSDISAATGGSVSETGTQTLTNKTISLTDNTITATLAQLNTAVTDANLVSLEGTETLTNKTLTSPKINEDVVLTATATELNYVDGVTSAIQTQLDDKAPLASPTFTGTATTNDLIVDGDFTVNGTNFSASATTIVIEDNMVQLAHQNASNTVDLGLVVAYNDGTAKHSGFVRDVSADKWKLFKGVTSEPTTTVDFTEGSLDDLQIDGLEAVSLDISSTVTLPSSSITNTMLANNSITINSTAIELGVSKTFNTPSLTWGQVKDGGAAVAIA